MPKKLMSVRLPEDVLQLIRVAAKQAKTSQAIWLEHAVRKNAPVIVQQAQDAAAN
jgi:hypothetical protein